MKPTPQYEPIPQGTGLKEDPRYLPVLRITTIYELKLFLGLYPHVRGFWYQEYTQHFVCRVNVGFWYWLFFGKQFETFIKEVMKMATPMLIEFEIHVTPWYQY